MPAPTFIEPIESILDGKCRYEYYKDGSFSQDKKSRICHVILEKDGLDSENIILMIFTIRNQSGKWKIHSEGKQRMDKGATVPTRNTAVSLAKNKKWKYTSVAISGPEDKNDDVISKYVIAIESYCYGDSTVYDLTEELNKLKQNGMPHFYRTTIQLDGRTYSLAFIKRELLVDYLEFFDDRPYREEEPIVQEPLDDENGENILYYGVPGAGKSFTIDQKLADAHYERIVFHPDYTYSDFVGQIMPKLKLNEDGSEKLSYQFVPGPFTKALKYAVEHEDEMCYLVIEEINRGNAPAIFGDIFQLLDRNEDGSGKYSITNFDVAREVFKKENEPIKIPKNLSILATMNTSDQNVFTLDTAFQRRWDMKYVTNDVDNAVHANTRIEGSNITWRQFANTINEEIIEYNTELSSSEDKQLGAYFVREPELSADKFPEKALKYLWDDAFKLERSKVFDEDIKSIGDLVSAYSGEVEQGRDPIKRVMKEDVYLRMMDMSATSVADAIDESEIFEAEPYIEEN